MYGFEWRGMREGGETHPLAALNVLHHILVRLISGIYARLCSLDGQRERVNNDKRSVHDFALHQPHDLVWYT